MKRTAILTLAAALCAGQAMAWPVGLLESISRDARRLVPPSLARLMHDHEREMFEQAQRFPPELSLAMARDLTSGRLQPATLASLDARATAISADLREGRVTAAVVAMGGLVRIPADLSDPALLAGVEGYPPGVTDEYYAFVQENLGRIPVVVLDEPALKMPRSGLPLYWQRVMDRSRADSPVIRTEMFQSGKVVSRRFIDFRNPVFGVASLAYSRAVNSIAATWLAVWRDAHGDVTRMASPKPVDPRDDPAFVRSEVAPDPPRP